MELYCNLMLLYETICRDRMWELLDGAPSGGRLGDDVTPLFWFCKAYSARGHHQTGSLAGAAPRRKDIIGAQWCAQVGQSSTVECKGKSTPDVILTNKELQDESRA